MPILYFFLLKSSKTVIKFSASFRIQTKARKCALSDSLAINYSTFEVTLNEEELQGYIHFFATAYYARSI